MIATFLLGDDPTPHVVFKTYKKSLVSIVNVAWCQCEAPAGDGVMQLPDNAIVCKTCEGAIAKAEKAYADARAAAAPAPAPTSEP